MSALPAESEVVGDPAACALEADLLAVRSAMAALSLQATPADILEGVRLIREARKGVGIDLLRAWNSATAKRQGLFLTAIWIVRVSERAKKETRCVSAHRAS